MSKQESEMIKDIQDKNGSQKKTSYCNLLGLQAPNEGLMELEFKAVRNLEVEGSQMTKMKIYIRYCVYMRDFFLKLYGIGIGNKL